MLPALSCGTAMSWRCSAQGSWGCLAAPPYCSPSQDALYLGQVPPVCNPASVGGIALEKGVEGGYPGLCPQRRPPKAPLPKDAFPAFPKEGLGLMRVVSTQVLDNSTRRRLAAPPPSEQPSWDISKSLRHQELPRQLGGWRGTSRRDLCRVLRLDAGPHGDAFAEKEHPQRGFGDPLVPHTHHPPAGEGGPAGAQ